MRDLTECQAEVFRRSEKRIKARKQHRNHILVACVPVVFCVSLVFAFLPTMTADKKGQPEDFGQLEDLGQQGGIPMEPGNGDMMNDLESFLCVYAKVEVTGSNISRSYTKASEVLEIWNCLNACIGSKPEGTPPSHEENRGDSVLSGTVTDNIYGQLGGVLEAGKTCTITLTTHEGKMTSYKLSSSGLLDMTDGKTYKLTPAQIQKLCKVLESR